MKRNLFFGLIAAIAVGCGSTGGGNGGDPVRPVQQNGVWVHPATGELFSGDYDNSVDGVRLKMHLQNGRPHGRLQRWHASTGKLHEQFNFLNGKPVGLQSRWYPNGQKMMEANFGQAGLQQGKSWRINGEEASSVTNGNGSLIRFDSMGRQIEETHYQNGQSVRNTSQAKPPVLRNGKWIHAESKTPFTGELDTVKSGSRLKMKVRKGKPHGRMQTWYVSGTKPREDYYYWEGQRDGLQISWYPNGRRMMEAEFRLGELLHARTWKLDGSPASAVARGNGDLILFDARGELRRHSVYRDGRRVRSGK